MSAADRSGTEHIRRLKAVTLAKGPITGAIDYDTLQALQFGRTPFLRQLATGAVVKTSCCDITLVPPPTPPTPFIGYTFGLSPGAANFAGANGVAYANGLWVAVGDGYDDGGTTATGQNIIYSRNPALGWTASPGLPFGPVFTAGAAAQGIAYGNGLWVAVGSGTDNPNTPTGKNIMYSSDPTKGWIASPGTPFGLGSSGYSIAYDGNGLWVATGRGADANGNPDGNNILYSRNPSNGWSPSPGRPFGIQSLGTGVLGVTYANGMWVAVGLAADVNGVLTGDNIMYSSDPTVGWTASLGTPFGIGTGAVTGGGIGIAYGNGLWVATGQGIDVNGTPDGNNILYSNNPSSGWSPSPGTPFGNQVPGSGECTAGGITYAYGLWAAIGLDSIDGYNIMYSTDPTTGWAKSGGLIFSAGGPPSLGSGFSGGIAYGNGSIVAAGHGVNPDGTPNTTHIYSIPAY